MTHTPFPHLLDPARFAGEVDGLPYQVFFLNCDSGICEDLNF